MMGRRPDQSPDGQGGNASPDTEEAAADRRPDDADERKRAEREKAETEIAAGDVADTIADFA